MSFALILSNISTIREAIKQTVIYVLIGITVLAKISIIRNNKNFTKVEYSNILVILAFGIIFSFSFYILSLFEFL